MNEYTLKSWEDYHWDEAISLFNEMSKDLSADTQDRIWREVIFVSHRMAVFENSEVKFLFNN